MGSSKLPSRFLFDIDRESIFEPNPLPARFSEQLIKKFSQETSSATSEQLQQTIGDSVIHPVLGLGVIQAVTDTDYIIKFENHDTQRNINKNFKFQNYEEFGTKKIEREIPTETLLKEDKCSDEIDKHLHLELNQNECVVPENILQRKTIQHPIWGIGFVQSNEINGFIVRFPDIDEVKFIPTDSKSTKFIS